MRTIRAAVSCARGAVAVQGPTSVAKAPERFTMRVVASGFASPWEIAWGPDNQLWVTERESFRVVQVSPTDGMRRVLLTMHEVHRSVTQDGLLGLAFHPDFGKGTDQVFLAFTYDDAPGPALARRLGIRRYRFDPAARALVDPVDVLAGLPTHDDHVGGRMAVGPDRKLYLTIGDQGANFGGNRCMANRAQELPTAAQVSAKNWVGYQGKILRLDLDGGHPGRQPDHRWCPQPCVLRRPPQSAGPRLRTGRTAVRVRARPEQRRRSEPDRIGPQLRLAQRGRAQGRQGVYLRQLVGFVATAVRVAAGRQCEPRHPAVGAPADRGERSRTRSSRRRCRRSSPWTTGSTSDRAPRWRRAVSRSTPVALSLVGPTRSWR